MYFRQKSYLVQAEDALNAQKHMVSMHCKDKIPKFLNKYSQKRNIGVSVPIFTFMRL
jgi:hypothetical protein